ncbi:MAG: hypothetical protein MI700_03125 [Balneolales bacterium]|nr:hypothetical protein [Balneolales bacterium]
MDIRRLQRLIRITKKIAKNYDTFRFSAEDLSSLRSNLLSKIPTSELRELASNTLENHARALSVGWDDGRSYFVVKCNDATLGLLGYQHRDWDPDDVYWGGWIILSSLAGPKAKLYCFFETLRILIEQTDATCLYIEAYGSEDGSNIAKIYRELAFQQVGEIDGFYKDGSKMLIYRLDLTFLK